MGNRFGITKQRKGAVMNIKDLIKDIFAAIRVPRSKIELAECLGLNMEELMLLLDHHCPEGHIIHEGDGHIQVIPFDSDLCGYISPKGKQCKTRPRNSKRESPSMRNYWSETWMNQD